jgi:hypothetical protein
MIVSFLVLRATVRVTMAETHDCLVSCLARCTTFVLRHARQEALEEGHVRKDCPQKK